MAERHATDFLRTVGLVILEELRKAGGDGATKERLIQAAGKVSEPSFRRAVDWLRDEQDAPIEYDRSARRWVLSNPDFHLPLDAPAGEDMAALIVASAALGVLDDGELAGRLMRLVEQLDDRARQQGGAAPRIQAGRVVATATTATPVDPKLLLLLLDACNGKVVRMEYDSPWREGASETYTIEPWQLRLHDGALYLRAYSRTADAPRNFRVANIVTARIVDGDQPRGPRPETEVWGEHDPAFGVDYDRPGTATIRVAGPMARWLFRTRMHPKQRDRWIAEGEVLERTVPYRSCREFARRLLPLGSALVAVAPRELAEEVRGHAEALARIAVPEDLAGDAGSTESDG
ncbi:MAG: WYL domain-containing protein [Deltaproteobacteria bacterium]|nr:MAG: WYL domain-containing protein [Deltaproteobacteria bacterium]